MLVCRLYFASLYYYLFLQLPGTDEHSITFNFNATCYTGLVDLYYFYVNYQPVDIVDINRRYIANKEIVTFTAPANAMITIFVLCYQPNVVLFNYRFTEETIERLNVEYGITKMYSLDMDNKMLFTINKYDFDESKINQIKIGRATYTDNNKNQYN